MAQEFHTVDVLALEVETPPTSYAVNRLPNPSGEHGLLGWSPHQNTAELQPSTWGLTLARAGFNGMIAANTEPILIEPGRTHARYAHVVSLALTGHRLRLVWHDGDGEPLWASTPVAYGPFVSGVCHTGVVAIPTYAAMVSVQIELANGTTGAYPVGSTGSGEALVFQNACLWMGTAAETTAMSAAAPELTPQPSWTNILPSTTTITTSREALNTGTLTATIADKSLVPTGTAPLLRAGRRIRLRTLTSNERLFTGTIETVDVDWDLLALTTAPDSDDAAVVTLTAQDATAALVNHAPAGGPGRVFGVPIALVGSGIAWNAGGYKGTRWDWSPNTESTTALDALVVARDTIGGCFWVDRNGWLQAWHHNQLPDSECPYELGEFTARASTSGWGSLSNVADLAYDRAGFAQLTATSSGATVCEIIGYTGYDAMPVLPGAQINVTIEAAAPNVARTPRVGIRYYNASGVALTTVATDVASIPAGTATYATRTITDTVPDDAYYAAPIVGFRPVTGTGGTVLRIRSVRVRMSDPMPAVRLFLFGEHEYADAPIAIDPGINVATIDLRSGATTTTYGPYFDRASILAHGRSRGRFTVAPISAATPATWAKRFARTVHVRSAAGRVLRPHRLRVPITTTALVEKATVDLYDSAAVAINGQTITHRVTGIRHTIEGKARTWQLELDLTTTAAVSYPTV